jgi:hypothetical protein
VPVFQDHAPEQERLVLDVATKNALRPPIRGKRTERHARSAPRATVLAPHPHPVGAVGSRRHDARGGRAGARAASLLFGRHAAPAPSARADAHARQYDRGSLRELGGIGCRQRPAAVTTDTRSSAEARLALCARRHVARVSPSDDEPLYGHQQEGGKTGRKRSAWLAIDRRPTEPRPGRTP